MSISRPPTDNDPYITDLRQLCALVVEVIEADHRKNDRLHRAERKKRGPVPRNNPHGLCVFNLANECNKQARHWRWNDDQHKWLPICRTHKHDR